MHVVNTYKYSVNALHMYVRSLLLIFGVFGIAVNLHDSMSEECHTRLVSLIKYHGLFVPYIVVIFYNTYFNSRILIDS